MIVEKTYTIYGNEVLKQMEFWKKGNESGLWTALFNNCDRSQYLASVLIHRGINDNFVIYGNKGVLIATQNVFDFLGDVLHVDVMCDSWTMDKTNVIEMCWG